MATARSPPIVPLCQLRVGSPPMPSWYSTIPGVPWMARSSTSGSPMILGWEAFMICRTASGSAMRRPFLVPRTTTALSRLDPITAPSPPRPLARFAMFMMAAKRTSLSPAGPTCATWIRLSPNSSCSIRSTAVVGFPHRCEASRSSKAPSFTHRYTGRGDTPRTTMASNPANFSSAGKKPPASEEPTASVSGDRATALQRA